MATATTTSGACGLGYHTDCDGRAHARDGTGSDPCDCACHYELSCPVDPAHRRFFARFSESVCAFVEPSGDRGEDISNTYEGDGQKSPTWCYDCSESGTLTVVDP